MGMFSTCWRRRKHFHDCFLIGSVIGGEPVAPFNRSIIRVPLNGRSVETGTFHAAKTAGGRITNVEKIGRVTVAVENHLWIVESWIEEVLKEDFGSDFEGVISGVRTRMERYPLPEGVETMQLDVFSAVIVNRREDEVFIYRKPSSYP
jgi:hypothetical protein